MNYEGTREIVSKDRKRQSKRHRVSFQLEAKKKNESCIAKGDTEKPKAGAVAKRECAGDGQGKLGHAFIMNGDVEEPYDPEESKSTEMPRGLESSPSLSAPCSQPSNPPRFQRSNLLKALKRSEETIGYIENEKKRILLRLEHERRQNHGDLALLPLPSASTQQKGHADTTDKDSAVSHRRRIRLQCEESAKTLISQRLPLTMMSFVEESLKTAHFVKCRRMENGHGRIIHQILVDQHKQIQKLREEHKNGYGTDCSSSQKTSGSEPGS